jgi:hypothetical protein
MGPMGGELASFAAAFNPASAVLQKGFPDLLGLMEGWARTIQNRDAAGHVFRVGATLDNDLINTLRRDFILGQRTRHRAATTRVVAPPSASGPPRRTPRVPVPLRAPAIRLAPPKVAVPTVPPVSTTSRLLDWLLGP